MSAGLRTPVLAAPSFPASSSVRTNSEAGKAAVFPSGVDTVTTPAALIVTTALGLTSRTAFKIFSFSSGCKSPGFLTITLSIGRLMLLPPPGFSKSASPLVKSSCSKCSGAFLPGNVTSALPSALTTIVVPSGFTALIASSTFLISSGVKALGFAATILLPGKRAELIASIAAFADFLATSTSAFFLAPSIAAFEASLIASTSFLSVSLASGDNALLS